MLQDEILTKKMDFNNSVCIVVKGPCLSCKNCSFDTNILSTFYIWLSAQENNIKSQDLMISWQWDVITSKLPQLVNVDAKYYLAKPMWLIQNSPKQQQRKT